MKKSRFPQNGFVLMPEPVQKLEDNVIFMQFPIAWKWPTLAFSVKVEILRYFRLVEKFEHPIRMLENELIINLC